jgi:hypothetical protein
MGIPVGDLSPRGTGMGKKCSPQAFVGIPTGKFFRRGDGDGELFPGGDFPVAIPTSHPPVFSPPCPSSSLGETATIVPCPLRPRARDPPLPSREPPSSPIPRCHPLCNIFMRIVFDTKVILREGNRNIGPLDPNVGSLDTYMLYPSLGLFLLLFVAGFEARALSNGEHKLLHGC